MSSKRISSLVAVVAAVVTLVAPVSATFPGKNGRIAFNEGVDIWTMNPDGSDERQLTSFGPNGFAYAQSWVAPRSGGGIRRRFFEHCSGAALAHECQWQ